MIKRIKNILFLIATIGIVLMISNNNNNAYSQGFEFDPNTGYSNSLEFNNESTTIESTDPVCGNLIVNSTNIKIIDILVAGNDINPVCIDLIDKFIDNNYSIKGVMLEKYIIMELKK